ncbi:jerky protein homolog-like [Toxorhynchites rutilus septentrionalis]|uniref:jerky protein homolog-like n=1 Tax=Toxorhynchites rutilus septentrionalis TaxID=329112 RepID=UPI002479073D|nr:jerky protein homolog-like [Toxorhynchites rutilus septentrionalis]
MDGLQGSSTNVNRKRRSNFLTVVEKVRIIEDFEAGGGTHDFLGKKYGVGSSTVTRIIQKKEAIREAVDKFKEYGVNNRKTLKEQTFPLLEEALYIWILQQRQSNILLTVDILKAKAELLFKMFQDRGLYAVHGFSASDGWMHRFKQRFGLRVKAVTGEKASVNVEAYLNFKKVLQKKIQEMQLSLSQVFNADESALFIKLLATRSVVTCDETVASGRKQNKTRYTFMPCSNIDGSLKLPLYFICTAAKPRGINIEELPVSYNHSKKAWMTRLLFRQWFHEEFVPAVRKFSAERGLEPKALLVLDNCTSHYDVDESLQSDDGLIQVIYLPPNVTAECQPMDQAVINAIKRKYKRKLMLALILENEHLSFEERLKKINLQQCISWLATSWEEISDKTIRNSWKKLIDGLLTIDSLAGTKTSEQDIDLWIKDQVYDADHNPDWVTSEVFSDDEILSSVLKKDQPEMQEGWLVDTEDGTGNSPYYSGLHLEVLDITPPAKKFEQDEKFNDFGALHTETLDRLERLSELISKPVNPSGSGAQQVIVQQQSLKAPIPSFDGRMENWPKFKAMFNDLVVRGGDSDALNLHHLAKALWRVYIREICSYRWIYLPENRC